MKEESLQDEGDSLEYSGEVGDSGIGETSTVGGGVNEDAEVFLWSYKDGNRIGYELIRGTVRENVSEG